MEGVNGTAAPALRLTAATGDDTGASITYRCQRNDRFIRSHDLRDLLRPAAECLLVIHRDLPPTHVAAALWHGLDVRDVERSILIFRETARP